MWTTGQTSGWKAFSQKLSTVMLSAWTVTGRLCRMATRKHLDLSPPVANQYSPWSAIKFTPLHHCKLAYLRTWRHIGEEDTSEASRINQLGCWGSLMMLEAFCFHTLQQIFWVRRERSTDALYYLCRPSCSPKRCCGGWRGHYDFFHTADV